MALQLNIEDFEDFAEFSDSSFSLVDNLQLSKDILMDLMYQNKNNKCEFDTDEWIIENESSGILSIFDFNILVNAIRFYEHIDKSTFKEVVKCWIAINFSSITPKRVRNSYKELVDFVNISRCFDTTDETIEIVKEYLNSLNPNNKYAVCLFVLNFLNYYEEIDVDGDYSGLLLVMKDSISHKDLVNVRILPRTKDLLLFNLILNDFFSKTKSDSPDYYFYSPLLLWWNLTTLIPIRPFEFCGIKREGFINEEGKYFIHLPRSYAKGKKRANKHNIQVPDKLPISKELYDLLFSYKESTDKFGESETLLSYNSVRWAWKVSNSQGHGGKRTNRFPYAVLRRLLLQFYDEVVEREYSLLVRPWKEQLSDREIFKNNEHKRNRELLQLVKGNNDDDVYPIQRQLRLGDTRHIALMNMQRLGYHPVEMARFAGHTNLRTQNHYHSHQLKWVDTEVMKLMTDLNLKKIRYIDDTTSIAGFTGTDKKDDFNTDREWKEKFVLRSVPFERIGKGKKLELGICYDKDQLCPVDDCPKGCEYWRISLQEYHEMKDIIVEKINGAEKRLKYVVSSLIDLHKYAIENKNDPAVAVENLQFNSELLTKSKEIDECITQLAELKTIEERKTINEQKREIVPLRNN